MYCGSEASSKDMSLLFSSTFKHPEVELQKNRELMADSNLHHRHLHHQQQQQQNSGLVRYGSAPNSLLVNIGDGTGGEGEGCEDFLQSRSSILEAETMFARFMSRGGTGDSASPDLHEIEEKCPTVVTPAAVNQRNSHFLASMEHEATEIAQQQNGYSSASQMIYQTPRPPLLLNQSSASMEIPYRVVNSMVMDQRPQVKTSSDNCSNLIRHSSSPAGLFSHLTVENGYAVMRGMENFRATNGTNGEASPSTSRLKGQINFSPGTPSSSGLMSQISEIGSESIGASSPDNGNLGSRNGVNRCYIPGFPIGSWDESENFTGLKRARDDNGKIFSGLNASEIQNAEAGNRSTPGLTHHFSLPKTSVEMAAMEKLIQFQDSVPCKIRAKRGCATHPRSIAERVRRTKISERMRKLQELVPNMDKVKSSYTFQAQTIVCRNSKIVISSWQQTNTADMLELAVDYIKDLQKEVKTLSVNRTNCTCSSKQKPNSNATV
ncbi:hypothetical protein HHK36_017715 [Tetracentron sinense]|uniref:BHLH domain-containing protein n=1 Tax=Tetracentron sinense TaxID=13715 RepID=A0A835DA61_TETSI|nr:hypothetical protein HHK36_017715 [Tetracentron sinense]